MRPRLNNTERDIDIRSHQNTLIIVGAGTVAFGLWTVVKYAGIMLMRRNVIIEGVKNSEEFGAFSKAGVSDAVIFNVLFGMVLFLLILDLLFRLYIGASAIAEGNGTRKRKNGFYIFVAVIMIIVGISTIITSFLNGFKVNDSEALTLFGNESPVTAAIIEATSTIMLIHMVHSAHTVRKYRRLGKHAKVK